MKMSPVTSPSPQAKPSFVPSRRNPFLACALMLVLIGISTIMGYMSGGYLYTVFWHTWVWPTQWVELPSLSERPVEILAYRSPLVIVQTMKGSIFACDERASSPCQTIALDTVPAPPLDRCADADLPVSNLRVDAIDTKQYSSCGADVILQKTIQIDSNGGLWIATARTDSISIFLGFVSSCVGATLGLAISSGVSLILLNRARTAKGTSVYH